PLGFPAPLTSSARNPPAGQAVHTSWLSAAPQRFITVHTAFASSPASKYRSTPYYPPTARARPTRRERQSPDWPLFPGCPCVCRARPSGRAVLGFAFWSAGRVFEPCGLFSWLCPVARVSVFFLDCPPPCP